VSDTYDDYYLSGKAEADWAEFIDDLLAYANAEDTENAVDA
jgi:hypothetical protein